MVGHHKMNLTILSFKGYNMTNDTIGRIIYEKNADLVAIGAYKAGSNRKLDFALSKIDAVNGFLTQGVDESFSYEACIRQMREILK